MKSHVNNSKWIICPQRFRQPKLRLFCFPYAGAGIRVFRNWHRELPSTIETCLIQLPGREERLDEKPLNHLKPLLKILSKEIFPYLNIPFVFFGHSLGALICFELTRELRRHQAPLPEKLIVSGRKAPQVQDLDPPASRLSDSEFIDRLKSLNGTPEEVLDNLELLEIYLPILRADFSINESYTYVSDLPFNCSIYCYSGVKDQAISRDDLMSWKIHTKKDFKIRIFRGNHFFINQETKIVLECLAKDLDSVI